VFIELLKVDRSTFTHRHLCHCRVDCGLYNSNGSKLSTPWS